MPNVLYDLRDLKKTYNPTLTSKAIFYHWSCWAKNQKKYRENIV